MMQLSEGHKPFDACAACSLLSYVAPDGTVYHCPELSLNDEFAYGRLTENTFAQIWTGKRRQEVIRALNDSGLEPCFLPICCLYRYNKALAVLSRLISRGVISKEEAAEAIAAMGASYLQEKSVEVKDGLANLLFPLIVPSGYRASPLPCSTAAVRFEEGIYKILFDTDRADPEKVIERRLNALVTAAINNDPGVPETALRGILGSARVVLTDNAGFFQPAGEGAPHVAAVRLQGYPGVTLYIHPYFFKLPATQQGLVLYHELVSHALRGIENEETALKDTMDGMARIAGALDEREVPAAAPRITEAVKGAAVAADVRRYATGGAVRNALRRYEPSLQGARPTAYAIAAGVNAGLVQRTAEGFSGRILMKGAEGEPLCGVTVTVTEKGVEENIAVAVNCARITSDTEKPSTVYYIDYPVRGMSAEKEAAVEAGVAKALRALYSDGMPAAGSVFGLYDGDPDTERLRKEMKPGSNAVLMIDTAKMERFEDVFTQLDLMEGMGYDTLDLVSAVGMEPARLREVVAYAAARDVKVVFEYSPAGRDPDRALMDVERMIRTYGFSGVVFDLSGCAPVSGEFMARLKKTVERAVPAGHESLTVAVLPRDAAGAAITAAEKEDVKVMHTHVLCEGRPVREVGKNGCVRIVATEDAEALTVDLGAAGEKAGDEIEQVFSRSQAGFIFMELPLLYNGIKDGKVPLISRNEDLVFRIVRLINERRARAMLTPAQQYRRGYRTGVQFSREHAVEAGGALQGRMERYLKDGMPAGDLAADLAGMTKGFDVLGGLKDADAQKGFVRAVLESVYVAAYLKKGNRAYANPWYTRLVGFLLAENAVNQTDVTARITRRLEKQETVAYDLVVDAQMQREIMNGLAPLVVAMQNGTLKVEEIPSVDAMLMFLDLADRLAPRLDPEGIGDTIVPALTGAILGAA
jgi:radical SAM protein with 4Fe4S-binding SPASM domain